MTTEETPGQWARGMSTDDLLSRIAGYSSAALPRAHGDSAPRSAP